MRSCDIVLDDWQKEILDHKGDLLLCTGRQVGKTTIFAIKAAEYLVNNAGSQIIIVSLTEDQAKLIIVMILDYLQKHHKAKIAKGKQKPTQNKVVLNNKSFALARPVGTTGDAVRGFTGDVLIIDEASRMPELVWTASKPVLLTTAGEIWMCSTPKGKKGYFYECYLNKNDRYKVFHISSEDVIKKRPLNESWTEKKRADSIRFLEDEKKDMSELQYGQEYLGLFLEDLRQFFPDELIAKCCILQRPEMYPKHSNFLGCDIARMGGDECAYEIIHKVNDKYYTQFENIIKKYQPTTKTEEDILLLNMRISLDKIGIDAGSGSLGVGIYDRFLLNPITKRKVVAMNNRSISMSRDGKDKQRLAKEDYYDNMLSMMEHGELKLLNDAEIQASLQSVQWELVKTTQGNKIRIFGDYSHIAEGLVRAAWLAKKEKSKNFNISYI